MIFVDSNIPMYVVGAAHPNKKIAECMLEQAVREGARLVTDAEVFQEIMHRYSAINRLDAINPAFELLSSIVDEVLSVTYKDIVRARDIILSRGRRLSARDALHVAIMERSRVKKIMTFDLDFVSVENLSIVRHKEE